jgi:hypothetical protein
MKTLGETVQAVMNERDALADRVKALEAALRGLYDGTAEYVYLNHIGDPHNTTPMRNAAKALGEPELFNYDRLARLTAETKPAPGFCPECLMTGGHKLSCSKAETPCRIKHHDGAFKCYAHNKLWGAVSKPDQPCAGWSAAETDSQHG